MLNGKIYPNEIFVHVGRSFMPVRLSPDNYYGKIGGVIQAGLNKNNIPYRVFKTADHNVMLGEWWTTLYDMDTMAPIEGGWPDRSGKTILDSEGLNIKKFAFQVTRIL
jgi:hypothetical protein